MPRPCTVCAHERRREIDQALVGGASVPSLARAHGLSERALRRHRSSHLPQASTEAHQAAEADRGADLLDRARKLEQVAVSILGRALAADDLRTALAAVAEASRLLQVQGRLLGQLAEAQPTPVVVTFTGMARPRSAPPPPIIDEADLPRLGDGWRPE